MESISYKQEEQPKSVKEGALEGGIQQMHAKISTLSDMIKQIEHLQRVPAGYNNLSKGKIDEREIPALDQWEEKRIEYEVQFKRSTDKLEEVYSELLHLLDILRSATGVTNRVDVMKFDKDTGRQDKDK